MISGGKENSGVKINGNRPTPSPAVDIRKDGTLTEIPETDKKDPDWPVRSLSLSELTDLYSLGANDPVTSCIGPGPYVIEPYLKSLKKNK